MRITSTHARTIDAAPDAVGALLDDLASERDVLWPAERWPTTPIAFDRPLAVGAAGGHGLVRYRVTAFEPGRRVAFAFTPGSGLDGTHELRVEPAGDGGSVLTHDLEAEPAWWMRPVAPLLLQAHDALVEDLLDCAQAATGGPAAAPAPRPRWIELSDALEGMLMRDGAPDRAARVAGVAVPATLAALAALHVVWAAGSPWPAAGPAELADAVLGNGATALPPAWASAAVAAALAGAAAAVHRAARPAASPGARALTLGVAGAFALRGAAGATLDLAGGLRRRYQRLDLAVYSPLCGAIGAGAVAVARRHSA
jgi:hypothetical protein